MFEARLTQASLMKKLVDSMKDLVSDGNMECSSAGISLQAMDSSHVSLVSLKLNSEGFSFFRCDKTMSLGLNLGNLSKILKCAGNDDTMALRSEEKTDNVTFLFESEALDRAAEFQMKLMDLDAEALNIPEETYMCVIKMPSTEFQRICRDLAVLGDTCVIECTKEGIKFSVAGDMGTGSITHKHGSGASSDKPDEGTFISSEKKVELTFALRYLNFFAKATPLSSQVVLQMSPDVPIVVEYNLGPIGHLKYFLAPKIDEED